MTELTPRQQAFVDEYLVDLNATQAAIRSGYSPKTANEQGARLLANASVRAAILDGQVARSKKTQITQQWVVSRLVEIVERCMQHEPVFDRAGRPMIVDTPAGEMVPAYTFDAKGANGALALLAKHTGGFSDRHEVSGPGGGPIQSETDITKALEWYTPDELSMVYDIAERAAARQQSQVRAGGE